MKLTEPGTPDKASGAVAAAISPNRVVTTLEGTDIANGREFAEDHGSDVRYVADWSAWVVFDGLRWQLDRSGTLIEARAKATADRMATAAAGLVARAAKAVASAGDDTPEKGAELKAANRALGHAKKTQDMRALRRMLEAARSEPCVLVAEGKDVFDRHPHLLNCPNGTVDLRTGLLRAHDRLDFLTKLCPTEFDSAADTAAYLNFLALVFTGRTEVMEYVRRLSGYLATGETCDHSFHVYYGSGANGKSVELNLLTAVLGEGEYAHTAAPELLVNMGGDRHPTERVGLRGARLVVCAESGEDGQLDEAKLKALTSDDLVTARGMRQDFHFFQPTHKLILATNHRPKVRGTDNGIWRRLRLVPFEARFWTEADKVADPSGTFEEQFRADPGLLDRLRSESAKGVLADMVAHAVAFYRNGRRLTPPAAVSQATAEYRKAEDVIGQFLEARVRSAPDGRVPSATLYAAFRAWWATEGHCAERIPSVTKFGREVGSRFTSRKVSGKVYEIRLVEPAQQGEAREGGKV